jgi:serine phosphatase RsbU (regulator of sigma subunit)
MGALSDSGVPMARPRILVVDDDVAIGGTIKRYLRQYDIALADCVAGALDALGSHTYDLVLLDRRLPDGTGDAVIEAVRTVRATLPVIMMSGEIDPQRLDTPPLIAADDFIEKPFVREALVAKIERLLTAAALRKQATQQRAELAELHELHEREVAVARTIFDRIFARGQFPKGEVRHLVLAADRLAGDVVFGASPGGGRYRWMLGDVTGHTLSSALVTMPMASVFYRATADGAPLAELLGELERELAAILPPSMFCAGAVCELDRRTGRLEVWNGGSPDLIIRHGTGEVTQVASTGMPLAADRFGRPVHATVAHAVAPGDRIYAFSDGLIELREGANRQAEFDRLLEIARTSRPEAIFGRLLDCIPDQTGAVGYGDDISLVEVIA